MSSSKSPAPGSPASPFAVTSPADILSYVPHALGFMPGRSLVVLTTSGRRLGATLRVDLPPDGADARAFAAGVLSFLRGDAGADGTLVIVYSDEEWVRLAPAPHQGLVLALEAVLEAAGLPVRAGWFVSAAGWRDYFCRDDACCPWPGQPLDGLAYSALNAELIFRGSAFDASAPAAVLRAAPAVARGGLASEADRRAIEDAQAHFAACCSGHWTSGSQFLATSGVWDAVLLIPEEFGAGTEPEVAGFLLASIESRTVRDFLFVSACLGSAPALGGASACGLSGSRGSSDGEAGVGGPEAGGDGGPVVRDEPARGPAAPGFPVLPAVRGTGGWSVRLGAAVDGARSAGTAAPRGATAADPQVREPGDAGCGGDAATLYADVLAGRFTGMIAWARVDAMSQVLAQLAAVAEGESRAAALTMSGWFEYARGRGSRAAVFLDAAEEAVPGYRLARLLAELLRRGGLPAWARRRSTAWTADPGRAEHGAE
ncbi:DUF4192 family protein [Arthrobacter sp. B0490]|uniref:DUF4192 family protein n=1 Tax=Arthrobacter sp. B0490 TaxID=2058891 RepID=UPI000CE457FA|nr:DUF4192 family protein [Arthrobacter sp. B0490]